MWPWSSVPYPEVPLDKLRLKYDSTVVGGGTAGCVLANRLSAMPEKTVLLIERGPVGDTCASRIPLLSQSFAFNATFSRLQMSEYQPELSKAFELGRGSGLSGTSRINALIYTRGLPQEYDLWAESGCEEIPGWPWMAKMKKMSTERLVKFFESKLTLISNGPVYASGEWTNSSDPLYFPTFSKIVEACKTLDLPYFQDLNSLRNPTSCVGLAHFTRDEKQYRNSTNRAFLPASLVRERKNLHIMTNAVGTKLIIRQRGAVSVVEGVEVVDRSSKEKKVVKCGQEVVVCAGALGSPQFLMLSGIGPVEHLKEHGIPVCRDLPAVGNNLQDHFAVSTAFRIPMTHSLFSLEKQPWTMVFQFLLWFIWGTAMLLIPVVEILIFFSSASLDARGCPIKGETKSDALPDVEIIPMPYDSRDFKLDDSRSTFSFLSVLLRPKSKGRVFITSAGPDAPLKVDCKYLSNTEDLIPLRAALKFILRIQEEVRKNGYPIQDWKSEMPQGEDDESLDKFIGWRNRTTCHYTSTCRMGPREDAPDGGAVVDKQLRVFGVEGLRVADASVSVHAEGAPTGCYCHGCGKVC